MNSYTYSDLWKAIIRPPRDNYSEQELGPTKIFTRYFSYARDDFDLINSRKQIIKCSHFEPLKHMRHAKELPCVIYLHGNSSSRLEAFPYASTLISQGVTLFAFDFSGSGKSEGEYVSLGYYEQEDTKVVVDYLRSTGTVSTIALWGRSMGAATAILYTSKDPSIAGLVLDSAFSDIRVLAEELFSKYSNLPNFVLSIGISMIKDSIKSRANFNIEDVKPIKYSSKCYAPALFIAGKDDDFVLPHHSEDLYKSYGGEKNLLIADGDHNSVRNNNVTNTIISFLNSSLKPCYLNSITVKHITPIFQKITQKNIVNESEKAKMPSQDEID